MAVKTLNLPDELWEKLDTRAAVESRSRSNLAAVLLGSALDRIDVDGLERGLPRAADTGASGPAEPVGGGKEPGRSGIPDGNGLAASRSDSPDEASAETLDGVAWSHPSRGITGDLGGPLSKPSSRSSEVTPDWRGGKP